MMLWVLNMGEEFWKLGHTDDLLGKGKETLSARVERSERTLVQPGSEERVEQTKLSPTRDPDLEDTIARASSTAHATLPSLKSIQHD